MFGIASSLWQNHLAMREPELAPFRRLTRPAGYLIILYTGAPILLLLGWLDQNGLLPPIMKLLAAGSTAALALISCYMFVRGRQLAVAKASAPQPDEIQQPGPEPSRLPPTDPS